MTDNQPHCLACGHTDAEVPLIHLTYQGQPYWICPQDLPTLIHKPAKLAGILPGIEKLGDVEHEH